MSRFFICRIWLSEGAFGTKTDISVLIYGTFSLEIKMRMLMFDGMLSLIFPEKTNPFKIDQSVPSSI
jgi:hypothetical protein